MANQKKVAGMPRVEKEKYKCTCCGEKYTDQERNFYQSNSLLFKGNNGRISICKKCVIDLYAFLVEKTEDTKQALYYLCRLLDVYFDSSLYHSVEQQARNSNSNISQIYMQKVNSLSQYAGLTFENSTTFDGKKNESVIIKSQENENVWSDDDLKNKEDVIRMVGYDPFENENPTDQKYLYNTLVDFLDQDTLDDSFKLPIVIEIVKSFNQIDKLNQALALLTADISNIQSQTGGVKTLVEAKEKIYRSVLAMAKDNGISVNHNNNRSKGANTLNGMVKKLFEIGLSTAEVNLYDLETSESIKQIADISNRSIREQLLFDENDYTDMIAQQSNLIKKLDSELMKVKEENRLLRITNSMLQGNKVGE